MTFVLGAALGSALWMCADRRLSDTRTDQAVKIVEVGTSDGLALLAYAGIGRTGLGEISGWASRALRGVNLPLDETMRYLADRSAGKLRTTALRYRQNHGFIAVATLGGVQTSYFIDTMKPHVYRRNPLHPESPQLICTGSGANWMRFERGKVVSLRRRLVQYAQGKFGPRIIASELAGINAAISRREGNKTVSPGSLVVWRQPGKGGSQWVFDDKGRTIEGRGGAVPTVSQGQPVTEMIEAVMPHVAKVMRRLWDQSEVGSQLDVAAINEALAKIKETPDDNL